MRIYDLSSHGSSLVAHRLTVRLESARVAGLAARSDYAVIPIMGGLRIQGRISAGSAGWKLRARASCHRRRLAVDLVARRSEEDPRTGVEDHLYEVSVEGLSDGRYFVRLNHVWVIGSGENDFMAMTVFEGPASVGMSIREETAEPVT